MKIYTPNMSPPAAEHPPLQARADALGGKVLEGDVRLTLHVEHQSQGETSGIFEATAGKVEIVFPFTEHATILEGEVTLTDETGTTRTLGPGDSYFIRQGERILWDVKTPRLRKSFFNLVR
ncbi:cupin domain-containing protein [Melittangium boletus]|uniref:cupin domain-containing protein n=1 Tax=Melittangium boletus TaxID=83453 RepID=UPI003DA5EC1F